MMDLATQLRECQQSVQAAVEAANDAILAQDTLQQGLDDAQATIAALRAASAPPPTILTVPAADMESRCWQVLTLYGFTRDAVKLFWRSGVTFGTATDRSQAFGGPPPRIEMLPSQVDDDATVLHEVLHVLNTQRFQGAELSAWEDVWYPAYEQAVLTGDVSTEGVRAAREYYYWLGNNDMDDKREHAWVYTIQGLMGRYKELPENLWPFYAPLLTGAPLVRRSWAL